MPTGWKLTVSNLFFIPQRWVIGIMGFTCMAVAYMLRVCLNISITQMVMRSDIDDAPLDPYACTPSTPINDTFQFHGQYEWDEHTQGVILSAFYYGYVITHVPAGILAEKYGAKHTLGFGILITSLLTIATPMIVEAGGSLALIFVRVLEGLAEGPTSPALAALMARWVPEDERGRMGSLIFGGAQIGNIVGTVVSGFILENESWQRVFYIFGTIGVIWFVAWCVFVYSDPRTHPFISDNELKYLTENIEEKKSTPIPWLPMIMSMPLWAIVFGGIGHDWGYFTMVTDLPKYMVDVLKFNISKTGMLASLPYIIMWFMSFVFAFICDLCIQQSYMSVTNARKVFTTIASIGPGIFIVVASYSGCDHISSVLMFTIAMGLMGAYYCGMKVNILDISPNYSGTGTAIINGIAACSGILAPYLVGLLTSDKTQKQWQEVFWISFSVLFISNMIYLKYASGELQWWNDIEKNGYPSDWKYAKNNIEMTERTGNDEQTAENDN